MSDHPHVQSLGGDGRCRYCGQVATICPGLRPNLAAPRSASSAPTEESR